MGYHRAGFDVTGLDMKPQPRYPFRLVQGDALKPPFDLREFDVVHASPPCQRYSKTQRIWGREYPDLLPETRRMLIASGRQWVIENVEEAPMFHRIILCGLMFGLRVYRHRAFESSVWLSVPEHQKHHEKVVATGRPVRVGQMMTVAGHFSNVKAAQHSLGIEWMSRQELSQAIPPAYTEYIGKQLIRILDGV